MLFSFALGTCGFFDSSQEPWLQVDHIGGAGRLASWCLVVQSGLSRPGVETSWQLAESGLGECVWVLAVGWVIAGAHKERLRRVVGGWGYLLGLEIDLKSLLDWKRFGCCGLLG